MIVITNVDGPEGPCTKIHEGKFRWYKCEDEAKLFVFLISLLNVSTSAPRIFNVYGKEIIIPNNGKYFIVEEKVKEFRGMVFDIKSLNELLKMNIVKMKFKKNKNVGIVEAELKEEINVEDIISLNIKLVEPFDLPRLY